MIINRPELNFLNNRRGLSELKRRLLFVVSALVVFRIGSFIPIPGINANMLARLLDQQRGTILEMFNTFSGGALSRASIFTLGIIPYISASIIIQLLTIIHPALSELKKEGELGRRKINQYTRYCTLMLAIFQSIGIAIGLPNMVGIQGLVINPSSAFYFTAVISLVTGTIFLMWLGEKITESGIGNGVSMIIFIGIISEIPLAMANAIEKSRQGDLHFFLLILSILIVFSIIFFIVFIERSQRRITVHYAKHHQKSYHNYAAQNMHLPLKINMVGVIPAIFASSVILFPTTIISWFSSGGANWNWLTILQPGQPVYILLYASAIVFFCFFYTVLIFNPRETADNLKKSGAFIPGIRPGEKTAQYINQVMNRLTLVGAFYITFICLIPEFIRNIIQIPFYFFGGTSLLIVVVVIMEFMTQIQTLLMSSQYESALRKANLKSRGR